MNAENNEELEYIKELRMKAEQGDAEAQFILGLQYWDGIGGVDEDKTNAWDLICKAADQEYANAQNFVGKIYQNGFAVGGFCVDEDLIEAAQWFRKAAKQGHAKAQCNLGVAYGRGEGVIQDWREAYIWLYIAKENDNKCATKAFRDINWSDCLSEKAIETATIDAKRRMAEIEASGNPRLSN